MQCGLYGKLPAKRDFIAIGATREFLNAWEPWLQGAVSASRTMLGDRWHAAFLSAPIWRFWLGSDICGRSVVGALMSSLDGVGRYFPLTLFAGADDGTAIPPPELRLQDAWFDAAETFLIATLETDVTFELTTANLGALPLPFAESVTMPAPTIIRQLDGTLVMPTGTLGFAELFSAMRVCDHGRIYAGSTFWWTIGGDGFAPHAFSSHGMPDTGLFSAMLTGEFAEAAIRGEAPK